MSVDAIGAGMSALRFPTFSIFFCQLRDKSMALTQSKNI